MNGARDVKRFKPLASVVLSLLLVLQAGGVDHLLAQYTGRSAPAPVLPNFNVPTAPTGGLSLSGELDLGLAPDLAPGLALDLKIEGAELETAPSLQAAAADAAPVLKSIAERPLAQRSAESAHGASGEIHRALTGQRWAAQDAVDATGDAAIAAAVANAAVAESGFRSLAPNKLGPDAAADRHPLLRRGVSGALADFVDFRRAYYRGLYYYVFPRALQRWRQFKTHVATTRTRHPIAFSGDERAFYADMRAFGTTGHFYGLGFSNLRDGSLADEARGVFERYYKAPGVGAAERAAFDRYLERARKFAVNGASSNYTKIVRDTLLRAATTDPKDLAAYFESRVSEDFQSEVDAFRADRMSRVYTAFDRVLRRTLAEENPDDPDRVVAAVVLGSFATDTAKEGSDFDLQLVTASGRTGRGYGPFLERLKKAWAAELPKVGGARSTTKPAKHPVGALDAAVGASKKLLLHFHSTKFIVVSNDKALEDALQYRAGDKLRFRQREMSVSGRAKRWMFRNVIRAVVAYDELGARLSPNRFAAEDEPLGPSERKRALGGLFLSRTVSIGSYVLTMIAYPLMAYEMVGPSGFGTLMAFGALATIGFSAINGRLSDTLTFKELTTLNTVIRVVTMGAVPVLLALGWLNFWTLLFIAVVNGWNMNAIRVTEGALNNHLTRSEDKKESQKRSRSLDAILTANYLAVQVALTIFLSAGAFVDAHGFGSAFAVASAVHLLVVLPVLRLTMPGRREFHNGSKAMRGRILGAWRLARPHLLGLGAIVLSSLLWLRSASVLGAYGVDSAVWSAPLGGVGPYLFAAAAAYEVWNIVNSVRAWRAARAPGERRSLGRTLRDAVWGQRTWIGLSLLGMLGMAHREALLGSAVAWFGAAALQPLTAFFYLGMPLLTVGAIGLWTAKNYRKDKQREAAGEGAEAPWNDPRVMIQRHVPWALNIAAAVASYTVLDTALPAVMVLLMWTTRFPGFKLVWDAPKTESGRPGRNRLKLAMLLAAFGSFLFFPIQSFVIPVVAKAVSATPGALQGELLGALFLGQLLALSNRFELPKPWKLLIQAGLLGAIGAWSWFNIFPGNALALGGVVAVAALIWGLQSAMTPKAWTGLMGAGMLFAWVPYFMWGNPAALVVAVAMMGMFFSPLFSNMQGLFIAEAQRRDPDRVGEMLGVQTAFFGGAMALAYAAWSTFSKLVDPLFPVGFLALGLLFTAGAAVYWLATRLFPEFRDMRFFERPYWLKEGQEKGQK